MQLNVASPPKAWSCTEKGPTLAIYYIYYSESICGYFTQHIIFT